MIFPVNGRIASKYGNRKDPITGENEFHNGIDIAASTGTIVKSPYNGTVKSIYSNSTGGNQLIVTHTNGFTTGYAHLSNYLVKQGETVKKGQPIALVGETGRVTGPHLHFTLKNPSGSYIDPLTKLA